MWILGGDRPPGLQVCKRVHAGTAKAAGFPPDQDWTPIWREVARGIADGSGRSPLIVYHPQGGPDSSSVFLHHEPWLSMNGMQSGHGSGHDVPVWDWIARDYALAPPKPTLDLEPNYEELTVTLAQLESCQWLLPRSRCQEAGLPFGLCRRLRCHLWPSRGVGICQRPQHRRWSRRSRLD